MNLDDERLIAPVFGGDVQLAIILLLRVATIDMECEASFAFGPLQAGYAWETALLNWNARELP